MSRIARSFDQQGYAFVDALSAAEAAEYHDQIVALHANRTKPSATGKWGVAHGVTRTPELWPLITHHRILEAVSEVLQTEELIYAEHSAIKLWRRCQASGWHRDSIGARPDPSLEWSPGYRVVRVACYFQAPVHRFMWGAIGGSQRAERQLRPWERSLWRRVQTVPPVEIGSRLDHLSTHPHGRPWIRTGRARRRWHPPTAPSWIPTRPTSCVLFDPRLIHAGGPVRDTKVAAFFALGANNGHTLRHRAHFGGVDRHPYRPALDRYLHANGLSGS